MKYPSCCLADFRTGFSKLVDIAPEFFSRSFLYLMSKLLAFAFLHNITRYKSKYLKLFALAAIVLFSAAPVNAAGSSNLQERDELGNYCAGTEDKINYGEVELS